MAAEPGQGLSAVRHRRAPGGLTVAGHRLTPASEADLAGLVREAPGPFVVQGGGTRGLGAAAAADGAVLCTQGLTGVRLYEPGALTLVVAAGTALDEIEALLAQERQRLAFEPPDPRGLLGRDGRSTIGGVAAANASGPRRLQAGGCRDSLLGVRFVDGAGQVISNGGRVMKNVTGYDLVKLVAGAQGRLGVLTEVSLKVQAIPEAEATLVAEGLPPDRALADLRRALGAPYDISGAAHQAAGGISRSMVRLEGMTGSVGYRSGRLRALLGDWSVLEGPASAALWQGVRDVSVFAGRPGAVWRLVLRPTAALKVPEALTEAGIAHEALWDWAGGLLWLLVPDRADAAAWVIRPALGGDGHATLLRPPPALPAGVALLPPESAAVAALTAGLRARFDPRAIFNPGLH
jgi:glycolate oxidase FAD binding subunit